MRQMILVRLKRWAQPELDRTLVLLKKANEQLERTLHENTILVNRNEELQVKVHRLESDSRDLHHQLDLLRKANELQGTIIDKLERHQRELTDKYEYMLGRVLQLEAKLDKQ